MEIMNYPTLSFPVLVAFLLFVWMVLKIWNKSIVKSNGPPPGPWRLPLIGNIHQLVGDQLPHVRLRDLAKTYGPIMRVQFGQVPAVVISSAETAKQVLKTHELKFIERPSLPGNDIFFYNSTDIIFAPYGDYWRQMRKIAILELLSSKRVQSFKSIREEEVSDFIKFVYSKAGTPVNLSNKLLPLIHGIIATTSIGSKVNKQEELIRIITSGDQKGAGFIIAELFPNFKLLQRITGMHSTIHRIHRQIDQILEEIVDEHKANNGAAVSSKNEIIADNILDVLLHIQQHGSLEFPLTTDNIKAIILEMFSAASDTTSTTIEWAMSEMVKNPCVMKKAQEEVREVLGENGYRDEANLRKLKYLKLVIKESVRLHPPLSLIIRQCNEACQINGYEIHPKTRVFINAWAIGRDLKSWMDPERFYPERFLDSSVDFKGTDFEFIPFGAGKRMCPDITMAMANVELIIAQLLYHFNWQLPNGAKPESLDMSQEARGVVTKRKVDLNLIPTPFIS